MADSSKKDTPAQEAKVEEGKKEEEKPVVEEVISIEDGQFNLHLPELPRPSQRSRLHPTEYS